MTLKALEEGGATVHLAVATSGASGVDDCDCDPPTKQAKAALREEEQRASCRLFGLPEERLRFLRLEEDAGGHPVIGAGNGTLIAAALAEAAPDAVFLPHGNDTSLGHRRVYEMVRSATDAWARRPTGPGASRTVLALLNRDPKTIAMREDVVWPYDGERAAWKGALLRCHASQQRRNQRTRGRGFDERILAMDHDTARRHRLAEPYAEAFELESYGDFG